MLPTVQVVCQAPSLFEYNALLLVKLNEAHCNGMLAELLGAEQRDADTACTHRLHRSWAVLRHEKQVWLNVGYCPSEGSVPHSFYKRSAELLFENSFVARYFARPFAALHCL